MTQLATIQPSLPALSLDTHILSTMIVQNDLSKLTPQQRVDYYGYRCQMLDLDPAGRPFDYLTLNGKLVLYANANCAQQLSRSRRLTSTIVAQTKMDDSYVVQVRVSSPDGRATDNIGAVNISGLKGDALCNALMKATTKALRRTIFAHEGLGMLDETEVESIPSASRVSHENAEFTVRPGDADLPGANHPVSAHDDGGWSEEEVMRGMGFLGDYIEKLCEAGHTPDEAADKASFYRKQFHTVEYPRWESRILTAFDRIKNPSVNVDLMSQEQLEALVTEQWFKVRTKWGKEGVTNETHMQNKAKKHLKEWTEGTTKGTHEYFLALAKGQLAELANVGEV